MKRSEKELEVKNLSGQLSGSQMTILTDYCGLTVKEITDLRRSLRAANAEMKVVKNTLAKIAVEDTELKVLKDYFSGTVAMVTAQADPIASAKVLVKFAKEIEKLKIKVGFFSGKLLTKKEIEVLSDLPSREQMLSSLLGSMNAPAQKLVNVLVALPRQLVTVLAAIRDKKES